MASSSSSNFDENLWIIQIRRSLDEELDNEITEIPMCIFSVPKVLRSTDPDSYTPQEVAIGPYHHWRPELYEMARYKLAAARNFQKKLRNNLKIEHLVDELIKYSPHIRTCYNKYLDFRGETLAWMMAIDASFILEFLQVYAINSGKRETRAISSMILSLVDYEGTKSAHNAILRDMMMLENQIPLFILRKLLEFQYSSLEIADDMLLSVLKGLSDDLSPFTMMLDSPKIQVSETVHLLDFLYRMLVPKIKAKEACEITEEVPEDQHKAAQPKVKPVKNSGYVNQLLIEIWKLLSKLNRGPIRLLKFVVKVPWTIMSNLLGLSKVKQPAKSLLFPENAVSFKTETGSTRSINRARKPPSVEEIAIPSVSELAKYGVRFLPTNGGISTISFDAKTVTLHLPSVTLDVNAEVILRNLVAYEASTSSGHLVFTRYTELMNGIIDTEDDVQLLRAKGIVLNHLKSDAEAANLWNGMSKSIKLTKVPHIDKVIEDLNKYYNGRWKVKAQKTLKFYVYSSWQFLTLMATIMLLLLMTVQAFCSVYSCPRVFYIDDSVSRFSSALSPP